MPRNKINEFLLFISALVFSNKAFAELDIEEIDINHEDMPEILPDLPQVQDVENAVQHSGSFMSQYINEQNLIIAVVVLACVVIALLIVIIYSKFQQPSSPKAKKNKNEFTIEIPDDEEFTKDSKDIEGAVQSFLVRTNLMH